jgi:hypothetical protein
VRVIIASSRLASWTCSWSVLMLGMSGALGGHVIDVAQCLIDQRGHVRIEEPVYDGAPVSIADDEPEVSEDSELMGDGWLFHPQLRAQLTDRAGADTETRQNSHAGGRRQCAHEPGDVLRGVERERVPDGGVDGLTHAGMFTCAYVHVNGHVSVWNCTKRRAVPYCLSFANGLPCQ